MIYTFTAPEDGWFASSHYFATPDGVFVFDTQLVVDYAEALLEQIKNDVGDADITSVFLTHPHPDHYNGAPLLSRRTKAVFYATKASARLIARRAEKELGALKAVYKKRLPNSVIEPGETFKDAKEFKWKGLTLRLTDVGLAESPTNLICYIPERQALISGDLIYNRVHLKFTDGNSEEWRSALQRVRGLKLKRVYPGHGPVVGAEIIPHLIRYIDHFQMAVEHFGRGKARLDADDHRRIVGVMCDKYPDYQLPGNLEISLDSEFARQRGKRKAA